MFSCLFCILYYIYIRNVTKYIFSIIYYILDIARLYPGLKPVHRKGVIKIKFKNQRYLTVGVKTNVSLPLQLLMWQLIDELDGEKDYLQVFKCRCSEGKQKIEHVQEEPEYKERYLLNADTIFIGKIYVIDNGQYTTMMLAEEY